MPPQPVASGSDVCRALTRAGFIRKSPKGSHVKTRHADGRTAIVPLRDEVAPGTPRSILRQSGLSLQELITLLAG